MAALPPSAEPSSAPTEDRPRNAALTPPTSEEWDKKDGDSSELSDLDLDYDDIGEIEPDHYYEGGKIPVFKPTMEQFRDFKKFVDKIDKYGMKSGIVKVIPPQEWRDSLPALDESVKTIKVKNPIMQEFASPQFGAFNQANIEKQRSYNLPQWRALTEESSHQPPAKRGERRRNQEKSVRAPRSAAPKPAPPPSERSSSSTRGRGAKRGRGRPNRPSRGSKASPTAEQDGESEPESNLQAPPTPTSPDNQSVMEDKPKRRQPPAKTKDSTPKPKAGQATSVAERRKYNRKETVENIDHEAFKGFDYRFYEDDEYTPERCAELETAYWKSLTFNSAMYGADMPGSLFNSDCNSWNVAKLPNLLDVLGQEVPGVNTAYLYLGMWKATFAWHLEDVDLYSINYIHFGAPKQWYSISQEDARKFEAAMRTLWPRDAKHCSQFLRHKTYLISPNLLKSRFNIEVNRLVHHQGEFVITFPYGYHSGYNIGYNCAESVNFATESWLEFGKIAKKCDCAADSVWIDAETIERKLRGEPTPEYYEETDEEDVDEAEGHLPSPPPSVVGKSKKSSLKRKRSSTAVPERKVKKIRIRIRTAAVKPCVLCPNDPPNEPLLRTDTGARAHRVCALYTPETKIQIVDGEEKIVNVARIDKARLDLKCHFCRSREGSCFQCSAKKCVRAFHGTCAAAAGVRVDCGPSPVWGEDGTEYYTERYDFRCRFHRPKRPKALCASDAIENVKAIKHNARGLKKDSVAHVQFFNGDIFGALVVENRPDEETLLVDVLPDGDRIEVEWKWVLYADPADSQLPKPSADAKPMPPEMEEQDEQTMQDRHAEFGLPVEDDPFCDAEAPQKWAEFIPGPATTNPYQTKIDLGKNNQLWHYIGKTSTEARAQFTEDADNPRYNSAGNFLDTVRPSLTSNVTAPKRALPAPYTPGTNQHAPNGVTVAGRQQSQDSRSYEYKPRFSPPQGIDSYPRPAVSPISPIGQSNSSAAAGTPTKPPRQPARPKENTQSRPSTAKYEPPPQSNPYLSNLLEGIQQWAEVAPKPSTTQNNGVADTQQTGTPANHRTSISSSKASTTPVERPASSYSWSSSYRTSTYGDFPSDFFQRVRKYSYLLNSCLRRQRTYSSPYGPLDDDMMSPNMPAAPFPAMRPSSSGFAFGYSQPSDGFSSTTNWLSMPGASNLTASSPPMYSVPPSMFMPKGPAATNVRQASNVVNQSIEQKSYAVPPQLSPPPSRGKMSPNGVAPQAPMLNSSIKTEEHHHSHAHRPLTPMHG